ncbi:hypothetical protein [Limnoglobus roseus]|uniref:Tail terminator n=1 Tax=Limnoglobus roseus TaxID=2598579 RepID=A0A5C1AJG2_9BACT|nr:hypothetical protein [Limnoglobus roseus]QEL18307.1 hypothetical protein PX52LOC_05328 [Limnoglobus roseus]
MAYTADVHGRIRDAVAAALRGVAETMYADGDGAFGVPAEQVYAVNKFVRTQVDLPAVVVSYEGLAEQVRGGTNREDDVAYPVFVGLYVNGPVNNETAAGGPTLTQFRDTVRGLFHNRRLAGVPEVYQCEVSPQPLVQEGLPGYEQLATSVVVTAAARVERNPTWSKT